MSAPLACTLDRAQYDPVGGIFISYRRADSDGWAGRLRDALRQRFGNLVFQDVDNIADGEIFSEVIDHALQECDVALIVIGPNWENARDEHGARRLDLAEDWVRTETALVLNRKIRVIPVLVGGARLPRAEDLPEELRSLARRQAREIRSTSWDSDVAQLASQLDLIVRHRRKRPVWLYALPAATVVLVAAVVGAPRLFQQPEPSPSDGRVAAAPSATRAPSPVADAAAPPAPSTGSVGADGVDDAAPPKSRKAARPVPSTEPVGIAPAAAPVRAAAEQPPAASKPERAKGDAAALTSADSQKTKTPATARPVPPTRAPIAADDLPSAMRDAASNRASAAAPSVAAPTTVPHRVESEVVAYSAPPATVASPPIPQAATRAASLNLPNRPTAARELMIGDSWTYRLTDVAYGRQVATVTHEIRGGDATAIREAVRISERSADASGGTGVGSARAVERQLPLAPRMFEQQLSAQAALIEFAPFLAAFSELQSGARWSRIASDVAGDWSFSGKVAGSERVRVPAGDFQAIRAELEGRRDVSFPTTRNMYAETDASRQTYAIWFAPEIGRAVKYERRSYNRAQRLLEHERYELISFRLQ